MNPTSLSNYQLYEIIQSTRLDKSIRQLANEEFNKRSLSLEEIRLLMATYDAHFTPDTDKGLGNSYKLLLIICPFFIELYSLFAGRMLAKGQKQKWKDYWVYICLGFLVWTITIILYAKYYFNQHHLNVS